MLQIFKQVKGLLFNPQKDSLKLQSIRAAAWSMLGKGGSHVVRMAGSLILTRILYPEAFGLMATANSILLMVQLFADTGVRLAIIQNPKGDRPEFLNTAWVMSIGRGLLLFLIICGLSIPFAAFYDEQQLTILLLILAFDPLVYGFSNPALPLFIKTFRVEKQVLFELVTQVSGLLTSIILSILMQSVYALALGTSITALYQAFASYVVHPFRPHLIWDKSIGQELLHFGKFIFLNTMITWLTMNIDLLLIGKLLNMEILGFYNLGRNLGLLVPTLALKVISQSYLPAVSAVTDQDIQRIGRIYQRTITLFLALTVPLAMTLALFSVEIIQFLYDPRYQPASLAMFWICIAGIFQVMTHINGRTLIGLGRPQLETTSMAASLILVLILVPLGAKIYGLSGVACAFAITSALTAMTESLLLWKKISLPFWALIRPWLQSLALLLSMLTGYHLFTLWIADIWYNLPLLLVTAALGASCSLLIFRLLEGPQPFADKS